MEAAIEFLRSNYVYTQIFSSIGKNFADVDSWDFLSVGKRERDLSAGKREIFLLARKTFVCWQQRDLSATERSIFWQERDLSVGKREIYLLARQKEREGPARPGRVTAKCEHSQK